MWQCEVIHTQITTLILFSFEIKTIYFFPFSEDLLWCKEIQQWMSVMDFLLSPSPPSSLLMGCVSLRLNCRVPEQVKGQSVAWPQLHWLRIAKAHFYISKKTKKGSIIRRLHWLKLSGRKIKINTWGGIGTWIFICEEHKYIISSGLT